MTRSTPSHSSSSSTFSVWHRAAPVPRPAHPLLDRLWARYVEEVPHAGAFARLARSEGGFQNDHIALRTLARDGVGSGIRVFAPLFEELGWRRAGEYEFTDVHLRAVHLSQAGLPRVFISELDPLALTADARDALLASARDPSPPHDLDELAAWFSAPPPPDGAALELVARASQYGAWLLSFGRKVNHFTAAVDDIEKWQARLVGAGIPMKAEIEGARGGPLRQTATAACSLDVKLQDGTTRAMPYAYFEIAERRDGFDGFLGPQARKLFEMTAPGSNDRKRSAVSAPVDPRRHERRETILHVEIGYGNVRVPVSTENLSEGGLFLYMPDDDAPGRHTVVELAMELPTGRIKATGTVVFTIPGRGVGIEFTWWDDESDPARRQLASFLTTL